MEEWDNISQQELANLVQSMRKRCIAVLNASGGNTRLLLLILTPPLFRDTLFHFCYMSVEFVQFMSQLLNLVMFIQIFTVEKKKTVDSELTVRGRFIFRLYVWFLHLSLSLSLCPLVLPLVCQPVVYLPYSSPSRQLI